MSKEQGEKEYSPTLIPFPGGKGGERFWINNPWARFLVAGSITYTAIGIVDHTIYAPIAQKMYEGSLDPLFLSLAMAQATFDQFPRNIATSAIVGGIYTVFPKTFEALAKDANSVVRTVFRRS